MGIPENLAVTPIVPAHFALAHSSRICVPRGLAVTPKRYTYAPAHLVFPSSWSSEFCRPVVELTQPP